MMNSITLLPLILSIFASPTQALLFQSLFHKTKQNHKRIEIGGWTDMVGPPFGHLSYFTVLPPIFLHLEY